MDTMSESSECTPSSPAPDGASGSTVGRWTGYTDHSGSERLSVRSSAGLVDTDDPHPLGKVKEALRALQAGLEALS